MAISDLTKIETGYLNRALLRQYNIMQNGGRPSLPRKIGTSDFEQDFANFYGATENIMNNSGTGGLGDSQNMFELHFLCNKRLGVGNAITQGFSEDALFNWFNPKKVDTKSTTVTVPGFNKWTVETDFKNQAINWNTHKRVFGIGLLCKFWTTKDDMSLPAPRKPPKKFQVISPLYLAPVNTYETPYIDYDEDVWKFHGGNLRVKTIHRSRIEVLRGTPQQDTYRGLSIPETIYLPLICYYNALIYFTKAMSKWGSMTPVIKSGSVTPTSDEYKEFLKLMEEFVMNGFFFLGRDDSLEYPTTNIGQGLYQAVELLKEEIASGTRIPLNQLWGRSESGGIAGTGNLTAERKYLNNLANEQIKISDDFLRIFTDARFDFEGKDLMWNLALQKTREQQLIEEQMEINLAISKQQFNMMKKENTMMKAQQELFDEHKSEFTAEQQLASAEQIKEDFVHRNEKFDKFMRMQNMLSLRGGKNNGN
jgi:hypothetical protein